MTIKRAPDDRGDGRRVNGQFASGPGWGGNAKGRPPKYSDPVELQKAVDDYFSYCDGELFLDDDGQPVLDRHGCPIYKRLPKPYTLGGLAIALDASISWIEDYQPDSLHSQRPSTDTSEGSLWRQNSDILTRARDRIVAYNHARLYDRDGTQGAQRWLSAYAPGRWQDKSRLDIDLQFKVEIEDDAGDSEG